MSTHADAAASRGATPQAGAGAFPWQLAAFGRERLETSAPELPDERRGRARLEWWTELVAFRGPDVPGMTCFYAGNAFSSAAARAGVPGVHLGDDLLAAADVVERTLVLAPDPEEVPSRFDRRP